uniref:Conopeptide n=1 Tax=Conus lenavati TaxID=1519839 RepID=A0A0K8TTI7_CONLV
MARRLGILIVTLGLLLHWSQAGLEHYCDPRAPAESPRGTCGRALIRRFVTECHLNRRKRRSERLTVSLLKKRGSIASLPETRAKRVIEAQGILCECCIHQCTLEEFQQHCPDW